MGQICEAFHKLATLAEKRGVSHINALPGCWEVELQGGIRIAVNGHREPREPSFAATLQVPAFNAYVEEHGWPGGFIDPRGGTLHAGLEDRLINALDQAIVDAIVESGGSLL